jgi:hypothetical protein
LHHALASAPASALCSQGCPTAALVTLLLLRQPRQAVLVQSRQQRLDNAGIFCLVTQRVLRCCFNDCGYAGGGGAISGIVGMGDVSPGEFDALLLQILVRLVRRQ